MNVNENKLEYWKRQKQAVENHLKEINKTIQQLEKSIQSSKKAQEQNASEKVTTPVVE